DVRGRAAGGHTDGVMPARRAAVTLRLHQNAGAASKHGSTRAKGRARGGPGAHGGRPDVRSGAAPVDSWAGRLNRLLSLSVPANGKSKTLIADLHVQRNVTTGEMVGFR